MSVVKKLIHPEIEVQLQEIKSRLDSLSTDPRYIQIEKFHGFHTSNDLKLADAVQSVYEILEAISNIQILEEFLSK